VQYLIEETAETVEAIEADDRELLREELGDLLLQVIFHAEIASEQEGGFGVEDVARGIADKLVARHPYVFASGEVPSDLNFTWEQLKVADATAISMARDYKLPMIFFSLDTDGTIVRVVSGEKIGTIVHA